MTPTNTNKPGILGSFAGSLFAVSLNLTLITNKGHGERAVGVFRLIIAAGAAWIIFAVTRAASISAPGATAAEIIWGSALSQCLSIFVLCMAAREWLRLYEAEQTGVHYISRVSGVPRFLPLDFVSWFVWPSAAVFVGLYDWHFFHILRPLTAGIGIFGGLTLIRETIAALLYRGIILDIRDGHSESKIFSDGADNKPTQKTATSPEDKTNELIQQFSF
jgi:hypothetical protein